MSRRSISDLRRRARPTVALGGGVLLLVLGLGAPNPLAAGAAGTGHHLAVSPRNEGHAVEGSARMSFNCNAATGQFKARLSGIQVIQPDHVLRWSSLTVDAYIGQDTQLVFTLHQNATNGLYEFTTNDIALPGDCASGNQVIVYSSYDGGYSLWLQAPLT